MILIVNIGYVIGSFILTMIFISGMIKKDSISDIKKKHGVVIIEEPLSIDNDVMEDQDSRVSLVMGLFVTSILMLIVLPITVDQLYQINNTMPFGYDNAVISMIPIGILCALVRVLS